MPTRLPGGIFLKQDDLPVRLDVTALFEASGDEIASGKPGICVIIEAIYKLAADKLGRFEEE